MDYEDLNAGEIHAIENYDALADAAGDILDSLLAFENAEIVAFLDNGDFAKKRDRLARILRGYSCTES